MSDDDGVACVAGFQRPVRLHHHVRVAAGDDAAHDHDLADGAGDGGPVLRRVSRGRAVRLRVGDARRHSASSRRRRDAGDRLQQSALLRTPGTYIHSVHVCGRPSVRPSVRCFVRV